MKHQVAHDLPMPLAKRAVDRAFESYSQRFAEYNPTLTWSDDRTAEASFSVLGKVLKGGFEITDKAIWFELDVPFVFRVFTKRAIAIIEEEVRSWVGKAKAGKLQ